jgi:hypothetical protein
VAAVLRISQDNFRLLHRLMTQIARVLAVNNLRKVTPAVVEVARENLVIGTHCSLAAMDQIESLPTGFCSLMGSSQRMFKIPR